MLSRKMFIFLPILLLTYIACDTFNGTGETRSAVFLTIDSVTPNVGSGALATINEDTGQVSSLSDTASITMSNRPKNSSLTESPWLDIILDEYQVTFYRTDGGTAVPNSLRKKITYTVDFTKSLTITSLLFLSAEQKLESPLWDLAVNGYDKETKMPVVEVNIMIEVFGHQVSGEKVYAKGWTALSYGVPIK
jgi:hypothetical protein